MLLARILLFVFSLDKIPLPLGACIGVAPGHSFQAYFYLRSLLVLSLSYCSNRMGYSSFRLSYLCVFLVIDVSDVFHFSLPSVDFFFYYPSILSIESTFLVFPLFYLAPSLRHLVLVYPSWSCVILHLSLLAL